MSVNITLENERFEVRFPYNELDNLKAKNIPDRRWVKSKKAWVCRPTLANLEYLEDAWSKASWSAGALALAADIRKKQEEREKILTSKSGGIDTSVLDGVPFKYPPMAHQRTALVLGRDQKAFAYLMDQGTGKTKTLIDDAAHNWREDRIDVVLLFTINSVKTNWVIFESMKDSKDDKDALETHMPPDVPYAKGVWVSSATGRVKREWRDFEMAITEQVSKRDKLVFLAANIESLRIPRAYEFFERICIAFQNKVMMVIDESTIIGTPGSKQTKQAQKLRKNCNYARILSGTPIVKSPLKAYSQFSFLDEDILSHSSFFSFRNKYAVMGGFENRQVLFYRNLEDLSNRIASCSYRVLKEDCLDLPPKVYEKRRVEMTKTQLKAYNEMREEMLTENKDAGLVQAQIILTQMLRLQQITGGYLPKEGEDGVAVPIVPPQSNPKFQEVLRIIEEAGDQRVLIWTRFTKEIEDLVDLLNENGYTTLPFYGGLSDAEKISVRKRFASDDTCRCIVGNPAAGGLGIDEFKAASIVIYVSNSFDTEKRIQSEDRTHRIGSEIHDQITYYDIICPNTVDVKIVQTMRKNVNISRAVMNDPEADWI